MYLMTSRSFRSRGHRFVASAAFLAGILACGGGDATNPSQQTADPADLPIVYSYGTEGKTGPRDLFLTSVDGATTIALPDFGGDEAYPAWKPSGRNLLVTETAAGGTKLLMINDQGASLGEIPAVNSIARWSPDGAWIVFANTGSIFLEVMQPDGSSRRWISDAVGEVRIAQPSWGPTDKVVYTFGNDGGPNGLNIQDVNLPYGGNLTTGPDDQWPAWSPDGASIAFSMGMFNQAGIFHYEIGLVNPDGSNKRQLTVDGSGINRAPTWSPDGKWLLYEHWNQAMTTCSFVRIPSTGGPPVTIVEGKPGGSCGGASWRSVGGTP